MLKVMALFATTALLITSCGKDKTRTPDVPPPVTGGKATLLVFGEETCTSCKVSHPEIDKLLKDLPADARARLTVKLYVPCEGNPCTKPSTQATADRYKEVLKIDAEAVPDPWRWQTFRKYIPGAMKVPAAAVLNDKGELSRAFTAGTTTFVPSEIVSYLKEQLAKPEGTR